MKIPMPCTTISNESVKSVLDSFPRFPLAHLPTPLEPLPTLSAQLGINLLVKRDDQTGLAMGGNKVRKLEFVLADALAQGADCIITWAGVQSNWCRQLAAAARKCGIQPILVLFKRPGLPMEVDGNVLLDQIYGAEIHLRDLGVRDIMQFESVRECVEEVAEEKRKMGRRPYIAPIGGSLTEGSMVQPLGALGYVNAALELLEQARNRNLRIDSIVLATGSGGMHAGLLVGAKLLSPNLRVVGISVSESREQMQKLVAQIAKRTLEEFEAVSGNSILLTADDIQVFDYVRAGYGIIDAAIVDAMRLTASAEGLLLDPVYTGKAMIALLDLCRQGYFHRGENVVFLHTGGAPAIFAYRDAILKHLQEGMTHS